jgi:hypothetical protein
MQTAVRLCTLGGGSATGSARRMECVSHSHEQVRTVSSIRRIKAFGARYIDYGMAWKGALFLAVAVWLINLEHGPLAALPAALKQATYTYFVAGFITRLSQNIAITVERRRLALFLAVLVPTCIALGLTLLLHTLKGTPEPLRSVIPTMLFAPPGFFWWARRSRREHEEAAGAATAEISEA